MRDSNCREAELKNRETLRAGFASGHCDTLLTRQWGIYSCLGRVSTQAFIVASEDISERRARETALARAHREIEALKNRLSDENAYLREEIAQSNPGEKGIVARDPGFLEVLEMAERVGPTDSTVLIAGETGTGKELVARRVHEASARRDRALVKLNCAALPPDLIESELFGHEKGAFSGAIKQRIGRFELADGGTLFLDEVGELPLSLQSKLLRVLQESAYERVGSNETRNCDVRIVAATNRDIAQEVSRGNFREDLYFRLHVFPLQLPPLRDRKGDIAPLAEHFMLKHGTRVRSPAREIPPEAIRQLENYRWPGNVRELENVIERALILSTGPELALRNVIPRGDTVATKDPPAADSAPPAQEREQAAEPQSMEAIERQAIREALARCNGVIGGVNGAAAHLKMAPSTLRDRIRKYGL